MSVSKCKVGGLSECLSEGRFDDLTLFEAIQTNNIKRAINLAEEYPNLVETRNQYGHTILFAAIKHIISVDPIKEDLNIDLIINLLKTLIKIWPDIVKVKSNKTLPLHWALSHKLPLEVIK